MQKLDCLQYALGFWNECPKYRIWYNNDHCINLPLDSNAKGFLPLEEFGYEHITSSFKDSLTEEYLILLKKYFNNQL